MKKEVLIKGKRVLCEVRPPEKAYFGRSSFGTSTKIVVCPFCKEEIEVYIWSFAGCGKNCDCGAKLSDWHCYKPVNALSAGREGKGNNKENRWKQVMQ